VLTAPGGEEIQPAILSRLLKGSWCVDHGRRKRRDEYLCCMAQSTRPDSESNVTSSSDRQAAASSQ
jgi:hypothetical protein